MTKPLIREATLDDMPEILRMGVLFCKQAGIQPDAESIRTTAYELMDSDASVILIGDGAMAGALAYPMYMNRDIIVAQELFWWVDKDKRNEGAGAKIMAALELWAKSIGAKRMTMIGLESSPAHIDAFYKSSGYKPLEISYWKDL